MNIAENSAIGRRVLMQKSELLSQGAARSPARVIDAMSRLYYLSRAIHVAAEVDIADKRARAQGELGEPAARSR